MTDTLTTADQRIDRGGASAGPRLRFGDHAADQLPQLVKDFGATRVFCVADQPACDASGATRQLTSIGGLCDVTIFSDFAPNPDADTIARAVVACRQASPDLVLAIGGGAAIDLAKMTRSFAAGKASVTDYMLGRAETPAALSPLIAVPTTAGSGSEATRFAVGYIDGAKRSIEHPCMLPDIAVVDPRLCHSLPAGVTAASGLDAFCQAVESIWSVHATARSLIDATEALRLSYDSLPIAHQSGSATARAAMSRAAYLAGCAINVTRTTACHALSYTLTSQRGIPHGVAVAATLSAMLSFNAAVNNETCQDPDGPEAVRTRLGIILRTLRSTTIDEACLAIERLITSVDCYESLQRAGLQSDECVSSLVAEVNPERLANNPRRATHAELIEALR